MFELECARIVGSGEEACMPEQKNGGAVRVLVS